MTLSLIFDTETTCLPARGEVPTSPSYPHLVQLAGILLEDAREVASFEVIVTPDSYAIPAEAAEVHGITTEIALRVGVPLRLAVALYTNLRRRADELIAHNIEFDIGILAAALHRSGAAGMDLGAPRIVCTAELGTPIAKLPPTEKMIAAGYGPYKKPTLTELHQFLFGEGFEGAHSALADCRATARCLIEIRRRGL